MSLRTIFRHLTVAAVASLAFALTACGNAGYSRGIFQGYVMGKTETEIVEQVGKPKEIDRRNPDSPVMVFEAKTFDVDNMNRVDPQTFVYLRKNEQGKVIAADVGFSG